MDFIIRVFTSIWWVNVILSLLVIYYGRKNPRSTLLWVMVLNFVPIIGFILYLYFGRDYKRREKFHLKKEQDDWIESLTDVQWSQISQGGFDYVNPRSKDYDPLIKLNIRSDNAVLTQENAVEMFFEGENFFQSLLKDIEEAEESIEFQFYIMRNDGIGGLLMDALKKKAQEGVRVRVLFDAYGSRRFTPKNNWEHMRDAGVEVEFFMRFYFTLLDFRMNFRNHRKLVIIDNRIGYIGGFNVGDDYLGRYKKMGPWRDTHLRITGTAAAGMKIRFLQDWYYASGKNVEEEPSFGAVPHETERVAIQVVSSGPDTDYPNIKHALIRMILSAKKEIYIQTPYLVPDYAVLEAFKQALIAGVELHLMIPNKPDHPVIYWATTSYAAELVEYGAKLYVYEEGFLHSKVFLFDDYLSMVGSANIDERSFSLNFETSAVLYDEGVNAKLKEQFKRDVEKSTFYTKEEYRNRPLIQRIKEPVCRLFSPLL